MKKQFVLCTVGTEYNLDYFFSLRNDCFVFSVHMYSSVHSFQFSTVHLGARDEFARLCRATGEIVSSLLIKMLRMKHNAFRYSPTLNMDVTCLLKLHFDVPALLESEETNLKFQELLYVKPFVPVHTYVRT